MTPTDLDPSGRGLPESSGDSLASRGLFAASSGATTLHPRTLIRRAVVAALRAEAGPLADRIRPSRILPAQNAQLPLVLVYVDADEATGTKDDGQDRILVRELDLVVEVLAAANDELDEILDSHARAIEWIVQRDETQGGLATDTVFRKSDNTLQRQGERRFGSCRLHFSVEYVRGTQEDVLPELGEIVAGWDLGPDPDGALEAQDDLRFQGET